MSDQDKVVGLRGEFTEPQFDTGVTTVVEDIYEKARGGTVTGIAVVLMIEEPDKKFFDVTCSFHGPRISLLGGLARLAHKINKSLDEDNERANPVDGPAD